MSSDQTDLLVGSFDQKLSLCDGDSVPSLSPPAPVDYVPSSSHNPHSDVHGPLSLAELVCKVQQLLDDKSMYGTTATTSSDASSSSTSAPSSSSTSSSSAAAAAAPAPSRPRLTRHAMDCLHHLMMSYDADLNEWKRFESHDDKKQYTRNLIATDNVNFTLMLLCWRPSARSMVHAHSGSECFLRTITGNVVEERYKMPTLTTTSTTTTTTAATASSPASSCAGRRVSDLRHGESLSSCSPHSSLDSLLEFRVIHPSGRVCFINDNIGMHRICNANESAPAVTLHLYLPPYDESHCFDDSGVHIVGEMRYDTEHGKRYGEDEDDL